MNFAGNITGSITTTIKIHKYTQIAMTNFHKRNAIPGSWWLTVSAPIAMLVPHSPIAATRGAHWRVGLEPLGAGCYAPAGCVPPPAAARSRRLVVAAHRLPALSLAFADSTAPPRTRMHRRSPCLASTARVPSRRSIRACRVRAASGHRSLIDALQGPRPPLARQRLAGSATA